ncbi:MAG: ComEC/Rec2 family competence protein [Eubacterium sp.]|nr:ComEC/Rec2 family competence protein [Eubacterium sp.]
MEITMKRVFAFVGFSSAITLLVLNTISYNLVKFIFFPIVILLLVSLSVKKLRQGRVLPIAFASMLFACLIFVFCMQGNVLPQKVLDGQTAYAEFHITDIEEKTDDGYMYTVKTDKIDLPNTPQNIKLKLKTSTKINADYYDDLSGQLAFYSYADNGFESYGDYGDGIFVRARLLNYEVISGENKPLNYYIIELRLKIKDIIEANFDEEKAGLALSIFTGDKSILSDDIKNAFKVSGLSHVTAVSGLHISLICLFVYYILKSFRTPKIARTVVTLIILFVYSGVANYSKSALRAGIMISVMLLAKLFNNKADTLNSLGFAVFIICLNPFAVTDASAVLTVTAVIGLSVIKPAFDKEFRPKNKVTAYFYDGLFIGISVLIATLPALWLFFGRVSLLMIILNIIAVEILQIALLSVFLLCLFSGIPFLAFIPKNIASLSLGALIKIADYSEEHFEFLYLNISDNIFGLSIAGILILTAASILINGKANIKIISVFIAVILTVSTAFSIYNYYHNAYVTVCDNGAVFIYDKDSIIVIDADDNSDCYTLKELVGTDNFETALVINSENKMDKITEILPNAEAMPNSENIVSVCEHIEIKNNDGVILASVSDKVFKIDKDYVTINGYTAYRNIYDKFSESKDITFIVSPNMELQLKEG